MPPNTSLASEYAKKKKKSLLRTLLHVKYTELNVHF